MKEMVFKTIRFLVKILLTKTYRQFIEKASQNPQQAQEKLLEKILGQYNQSKYSEKFGQCRNYEEYAQKVPFANYEDFEDLIIKDRSTNSKKSYLCPFEIKTYEKTSGSSSKAKFIPYSTELLGSFTNMFKIWLYDVISNNHDFKNGKCYFSISPIYDESQNIGLEDDRGYLTGIIGHIMSPFFVAPDVKKIKNTDNFLLITSLYLIAHKDLEVLSFWSPSWFLSIHNFINKEQHRGQILSALKKGQIEVEGRIFNFPKRNLKTFSNVELFPNIKFVSCWGDASAESDFQKVKELFAHAFVQKKGLLATEAPLTVPIKNGAYHLPLIDDIFYEFQEINNNQERSKAIHRIHELESGKSYELIISQLGGLYRYRMNDIIFVKDFYKKTPSLIFQGRKGNVSDMVGEKITEQMVIKIKKELIKSQIQLEALIPTQEGDKKFYTAITSKNFSPQKIETEFLKITHYLVAIKQGQLEPMRILPLKDFSSLYLEYFVHVKKMKIGDIKTSVLLKKDEGRPFIQFLKNNGH